MPNSGLFVTLYDEDTLKLYLQRGIYGFLMPPVYGEVSKKSRHYHALADYACVRDGTHVFFFLKRKIIYGGQITGPINHGAFYINGPFSPLGRLTNAVVYWDESVRGKYGETGEPGVFTLPGSNDVRCQPYLIQFSDKLNIKGRFIKSDRLYVEIGRFPYPLPTNTISGMGFCTMTPGEVTAALQLLTEHSMGTYESTCSEDVSLVGNPIQFDTVHGFTSTRVAFERDLVTSEAHLEAFILANPSLLPDDLRPPTGAVLCRQVPMSPFKPYQMDRANICYYSDPLIKGGTVPNTILELKIERVGKKEVLQVIRYLEWLYVVLPDEAHAVQVYLAGPSLARNCDTHLPQEYRNQIRFFRLM